MSCATAVAADGGCQQSELFCGKADSLSARLPRDAGLLCTMADSQSVGIQRDANARAKRSGVNLASFVAHDDDRGTW